MVHLRTILEVARQTVRLQLQNRLFLLQLLALFGVGALAFLIGFNADGDLTGRQLFCVLSWWLVAIVLAPWGTIYFAVQAVHGDIEDRTFVYLFARPVSRAALLFGKWLGVAAMSAATAMVGTAFVYIGSALHGGLWREGHEPRLLVAVAVAMGLLAVGYAAVGAAFGAYFKRPLLWGAAFVVLGGVVLPMMPLKAGIRAITVADPVRRLVLEAIEPDRHLAHMIGPYQRDSHVEPGQPVLNLGVIVAVALLLALASYCRNEYDSRERE